MTFLATKRKVEDQGHPPDSFLEEIVLWCRQAPDTIFERNPSDSDVYSSVRAELAPFIDIRHRRAVMLEVMRVHAGFESSWKWNEGVDRTNKTSLAHIEGQETGIFQVSFDSTRLGNNALLPFAKEHHIDTPESFIPAIKENHFLALDYYARLIRVSIRWAGPLLRREVHPWLSRDSVDEFKALLA